MVVESFEIDSAHDERNGVCLKCFGKVERVLHLQDEREKLKAELMNSRSTVEQVSLALPSPTNERFMRKCC